MNYSNYIKSDEPEIAYVDVEYGLKNVILATNLAKNFKSFLNGLVSKEELIKSN